MNRSWSLPRAWHYFATFYVVLLALAVLAWAVNVEIAIKYLWGSDHATLPRVIPFYRWFALLAVDLSTVSTLLPMLLLAFTGAGLFWVKTGRELPWWVDDFERPFPARFSAFCMWCGLWGTLHGLILGLRAQGTDASPIASQDMLASLIVGFKTAIISTEVAMIVAGAAICVSAFFRRFTLAATEVPTLAETLESLRREIDALKSTAISINEPFKQLRQHSASMAASLEACSAQVRGLKDEVSCNWFQQVLQRLSDLSGAEVAQAQALARIDQWLRAAQGNAVSQLERDRITAERFKQLISIVTEALSMNQAERQRFSAGLYEGLVELANHMSPSRNGSSKNGAMR